MFTLLLQLAVSSTPTCSHHSPSTEGSCENAINHNESVLRHRAEIAAINHGNEPHGKSDDKNKVPISGPLPNGGSSTQPTTQARQRLRSLDTFRG